ncbi:MAG: hypothetical protein M9934_12545 [Thermomicrobiales bacterium]|nr:hypothetical protein [Thermomicrobiales bacterium]
MTEQSTGERLYRESQRAICELITPENEHTMVPACPAWNLHNLISHLTGAMEDFLSGNTEGAPGDAWTAAQVERYRDTDLAHIKTTWLAATDQAGPLFDQMGVTFLPDIVTHEFDVRGVLGDTDRRDAEGLLVILGVMRQWKQPYFERNGVSAVEIVADDHHVVFGDSQPQITLITSLYEASRVIAGRRSFNQIRQLDWSADPEVWLPHLSVLGKPDRDVNE